MPNPMRSDIEEQVRLAKYCVKIDHRDEACDWLGTRLIDAVALLEERDATVDKLRKAVAMYQAAQGQS